MLYFSGPNSSTSNKRFSLDLLHVDSCVQGTRYSRQIRLLLVLTRLVRDGLNIILNKQAGIFNFRLRPSVEENLQTCAR